MTNSQFNPALPLPIKWNINEGKFGNQLTMCIPVESVTHLMEHLQNLVNTKSSDGKVYDFTKKENVTTKVIYLNAKAIDGEYGVFGNINPQKIESAPNTQGLF
tara:strand:+ start:2903 stop:3211 length:309 start_codon:yes stop_codon:yes gene_type:complete